MTQQTNPWLELGKKLVELTKQQPREVQEAQRLLSRKTYPEAAQARREQEVQQ
jgi:hypothetical protein